MALCTFNLSVKAQESLSFAAATGFDAPPITMDSLEDQYQAKDAAYLSQSRKPQAENLNASRIEAVYSDRIVDELTQFGYDLFDTAAAMQERSNIGAMPAGVVQDDYILSSGDSVDITVRGQINFQETLSINNQGLLIIDSFIPINAAGKSIGALKQALNNQTSDMHNTQVFVSLSGVRQINVLVTGHVITPGRINVTMFHTALDALTKAGGIDKTGSLRQIKLVRGGKTYLIDLYQLLITNGQSADRLLKDGDRIIVPPIGPTVAIAGAVKRPAIYEIKTREKISLHQALQFAGGPLVPAKNRYIKMDFDADGQERVEDVSNGKARNFGDGSILVVSKPEQQKQSAITLSGHTSEPGTHDLKKSKTLSQLIKSDKVLGKDIYPLIGVIERRDNKQLTKKLIAFSPRHVLNGDADETLNDNDTVHLFSSADIKNLEREPSLLHKASLNDKKRAIDNPIVRAFLSERSVFVRGAVRQEGAYPIADNATLDNVLAVAGGLSLEANKENIEVSSLSADNGAGRNAYNITSTLPQDITIQSGDTVRVNQKFHKIKDQSVMIIGEVTNPGRYDLMAGDTLLSLMERAGGVTAQGYAEGALFSRAAERMREQNRFKAQAQDLELKLASMLSTQSSANNAQKPDMGQVTATQSLITQLKGAKAVGRITVEADPAVLTADPTQDILLEAGDKVYIPKRPLTVRAAGEVLSPAALQFKSGKSAMDYINEAGGTTYYADKGRAFVIFPDGSAAPLGISAWNHSNHLIPPGSTIIVPRDPKPFDFLDSAERVSQILANLAISGLYIEAIGDD